MSSTAQIRTRGGFIPSLEGLRAVAALLVLFTHLGSASGLNLVPVVGVVAARGTWGVTLFFVLSGFLLTRPWAARLDGAADPDIGRYAVMRSARILPAYWVALAAVILLAAPWATPEHIATNATLTQIYFGTLLPSFGQSWSLCTEVSFYLALPLLAPLLVRGAVRGSLLRLAALALVAPVWLIAINVLGLPGWLRVWLPGHLDWFAAGMALAVLEPALRGMARSGSRIAGTRVWGCAFVASLAVMMTPLGGPQYMSEDPPLWKELSGEFVFGSAALALVGLLLVADGSRAWYIRGLSLPVSQWAGRISYGIFLWQMLAIDQVRAFLGLGFAGGGFLITTILATALTVGLAQVSWTLLENPIMRRAQSLHTRRMAPERREARDKVGS